MRKVDRLHNEKANKRGYHSVRAGYKYSKSLDTEAAMSFEEIAVEMTIIYGRPFTAGECERLFESGMRKLKGPMSSKLYNYTFGKH